MTVIEVPQSLTSSRLATLLASRLILNTVFRVAYPLVPFVVTHFAVSTQTATWIVTVQVLAGLASPLGGWLGDRRGYRATMALGLTLAAIGTTIVAVAPAFLFVIAGLAITGLGTVLYLPSVQAYVSAVTPFARRGRVLGFIEISWSLAGMLLVPPLISLAQSTGGLHFPFALLAVLLVAVLALTQTMLPPDRAHALGEGNRGRPLRTVIRQPVILALFAFLWLAVCGQEILFIVQAPWLTDHFGASPEQIAQTLFVFGLGELFGVSLATALTDWLGKRRAPLVGFGGAAIIYVLLPLLAHNWTSYLILFLLYALCFEFAIVSSFSLASGIDPAARGTVMAGVTFSTQTGRAAGSWIGVPLLQATNVVVNGIVAAVLTWIGIGIAVIKVRPQEKERERHAKL